MKPAFFIDGLPPPEPKSFEKSDIKFSILAIFEKILKQNLHFLDLLSVLRKKDKKRLYEFLTNLRNIVHFVSRQISGKKPRKNLERSKQNLKSF